MTFKTAFAFPLSLVACAAYATYASPAAATPRPLPFTYPVQTLPEGAAEVELYGDTTPLRVQADPIDASKGRLWEPRYTLQTEIEYGLTDRWELGFYQVFEAEPLTGGGNAMTFDGFKWRARTRLAEPGEWPIDVGLYFELETLHDELALEEKVLLERRFGRLRWLANLWVEQELERPFDKQVEGHEHEVEFVVNPTTGFTYEVTPGVQPGIEYWARGVLGEAGDDPIEKANHRLNHYVGPSIHLAAGRLWLSFGVYAHLNDMTAPAPGEAYGPVWVRSVLGIDL